MDLTSEAGQIIPTGEVLREMGDRWIGRVDEINCDFIVGWAYDRHNPTDAMSIEVVSDSEKVCVAIADLQRDDVKEAGHSTGRCGFRIDLKRLDLDGKTISVRFAESGFLIAPTPLVLRARPVSKREIRSTNQADADRWFGYVDRVDRTSVVGWAYDRLNPACSVVVEAVTSSGETCMTIANRQRDDVKNAGHGTGLYGFTLDLSKLALKDDTVIVRFAESCHPISKTPIEFNAQRAVLSNTMPSSYGDVMLLMAMTLRHAAAERGLVKGAGR